MHLTVMDGIRLATGFVCVTAIGGAVLGIVWCIVMGWTGRNLK